MEQLLHKYLNKEPLSKEEWQMLSKHPEYGELVTIANFSKGYKAPEINIDDLFEDFNLRIENSKVKKIQLVKKRLNFKFIAAAASILILFGIGYMSLSSGLTRIDSSIAEKKEILLPDGSTVLLNASSSLVYDADKWEVKRIVELDGQAYFKVAKGSIFKVQTNQGSVQVLGTQFNVNAREQLYAVDCYEGKVQVNTATSSIVLTRGQGAKLGEKGLKLIPVENEKPSWVDGESSFENAPLNQVFAELERQYNITIAAENIDRNILFTGSFTHDSITTALESICSPLLISYTINGTAVNLENN